MTPTEAARLLEIADDTPPEQVEARFLELRAKLEDRIAKAPTPGLKEKYRVTLAEITTAFEILALAADSSSLPVARQQRASSAEPATGAAKSSSAHTVNSGPKSRASAKSKLGGREFFVVAAIAVVALGAGGWWIVKTKAENDETARLTAQATAEADRQTVLEKQRAEEARIARESADKSERERQERQFVQLRARLAELNINYEAAARSETLAERELAELRAQERELARDGKAAAPVGRRLAAEVRAQDRFVAWLRQRLPTHPAKIAKAKAEEFLSARAGDEAQAAVDAYAVAIELLKTDIAGARTLLVLSGPISVSSNVRDAAWELTDAHGVKRSGRAPARVEDVAYGRATIVVRHEDWPDQTIDFEMNAGLETVAANLPAGSLRIESQPAGAEITVNGRGFGPAPVVISQIPPGPVEVRGSREGFKSTTLSGVVEDGKALRLDVTLAPSRPALANVTITSNVANAVVYENGRELGSTPLVLKDRPLGRVVFELKAPRHQPARLEATLVAGETTLPAVGLSPFGEKEIISELVSPYRGRWVASGSEWFTISDDGLTLHHPNSSRYFYSEAPSDILLIDERHGVIAVRHAWAKDSFLVLRLTDNRIEYHRAVATITKDKRTVFIADGLLSSSSVSFEQAGPELVEKKPLEIYTRQD